MRIGLFGGTFNPIHCGHLRSAEDVRTAFRLDRIYFIPAARPPHKDSRDLAPAQDRFNMVRLAVEANPLFRASAAELERTGPSYAVDTIRSFVRTDRSRDLFFIMGIDAFREIHSWKDYRAIPELCHIIVTSRPGTDMSAGSFPVALKQVFWYDSELKLYRHRSHHTLVFHEITGLDISASTIRERVRRDGSISSLVPSAVERYVFEHALYQEEESAR